ncbi:ABC-2 type transport system ATP-binding protein [Mucilaginibacter frigoritolerans]|uniref:ABC-2 type transport system ATP-binding protein n=1 Tax=Mucilaginibacter frigoritolerans TaxID=652788 RepID=A0A562TV78_9SPHI|nr:ATP-binding cassette domain-containing protein [Mucilaginibacter frigoritolerans]TWI96710.1 ABC-2 type transport system ATP-binding protein [Mucilaginibacter frigoritolerans]
MFSIPPKYVTLLHPSYLTQKILTINSLSMLSIRNIVKQYAGHTALNDVSLEVKSGQVFGLLGPNGAGKTSLIRIINQITAPDSGEVYFNGEKLNQSHIDRIGYLPEERGLYKKMEIGEQMIYLARLKGLSRDEAIKRLKLWFDKLGMETWWKMKIEELSKGMQQKAQFVATVLHEPDLIILDEPFSGFDPVNAEVIKEEILELNKKGATILFSTHRMESVEELCDAIALLHQSKKILDGPIRDIKNTYRNNIYIVEYSGEKIGFNGSQPFELIDEKEGYDNSHAIKLKLKEGNTSNDVLQYLLPKTRINMLQEVIPSMNEIFIEKVSLIP